jgi:DNA-directed RNA polymerase subunit RPC12/RpoP
MEKTMTISFHPRHGVPVDAQASIAVTVNVACRECGAFEPARIEEDDSLRCPSCGASHVCDECGTQLHAAALR